MVSVYGNAYLVISATHAKEGSQGCFTERSRPKAPVLFYTHKTSDNDDIHLYIEPDPGIHHSYKPYGIYSSKSKLPLLSRAWCFQERLLATRGLHFAGEDIIWECRSGIRCECTGLELHSSSRMGSLQGRLAAEAQSYDLWHRMVKLYMSRSITFLSDRFPAISGIVKHMQRAGLGQYVAGIWKDNLFADLLWAPALAGGHRVPKWRVPSWSWACLADSTVDSYEIQNGHSPESVVDHVTLKQRTSPGLDPAGTPFTATLRKLEAQPAGGDPTGEVISAFSTISAPLIEAAIIPKAVEKPYATVRKDGMELKC